MAQLRTGALALAALLILAPRTYADNAAILGVWNLDVDQRGTLIHPTLTLGEKDGKVGGTWVGPRGTAEISDVKYDGTTLTFDIVEKGMLRDTTFAFTGEVAGDALTGTMKAPLGAAPVKGTRAK